MVLNNLNRNNKDVCDCKKMTNEDIKKAEELEKSAPNIRVLGSGCSNCEKLRENTIEALKQLNINETVDYLTNSREIALYGVMSMPALVIKNKVVSVGNVLKVDDVKNLIEKYY